MRSLKKLVSLLCCLSIVFSLVLNVSAEDYKKSGKDQKDKDKGTATYYIIEGKDYDALFKLDINDVKHILDWLFNFHTFTVIKKYQDKDGKITYTGYFNTPNLQQYIKNGEVKDIPDGYISETYDVDDTQWIVPVGNKATKVNAITKYGFRIDSPTYYGEYPNATMNVAGVLMNAWTGGPWTALKSVFTGSFIDAPSSTEFNTIKYLNHGYSDANEYVVDFVQKYWIPYWVARIVADDDSLGKNSQKGYFKNADNYKQEVVTDQENESAERYIAENKEAYLDFKIRQNAYTLWKSKFGKTTIFTGDSITTNGFRENNKAWNGGILGINTSKFGGWNNIAIPVGHNKAEAGLTIDPFPKTYSDNDAGEYFDHWLEGQEDYMDAIRKWWEGGKDVSKVRLLYSIVIKNKLDLKVPKPYSDSAAKAFFDSCINTKNPSEMASFIKILFYKSNLSGDYYYYDGYDRTDEGLKKYPVKFGKESKVTYNKKQSKKGKDGKVEYKNGKIVLEDVKGKDGKVIKITETWTPKNHKFYFIDNDKDYEINYNIVKSYYNLCLMNYTKFTQADWLPELAQVIMDKYDAMVKLTIDYDKFLDKFKSLNGNSNYNANKSQMTGILYSQCLIKSNDKNKCSKDENASYYVANVYVNSGIYTLTPGFNFNDFQNTNAKTGYWTKYPNAYINRTTLTRTQAVHIIDELRNNCTVYYSEVMANIIKIMILNAKSVNDYGPADMLNKDEKRIMPYDVESLTQKDAANYSVGDPRVQRYKTFFIGNIVSTLALGNISHLLAYCKPQLKILEITGTITELSVWMQTICNFNALEGFNERLSPSEMWGSKAFAALLLGVLALYFVIKTIQAIIKFCSGNGSARDTKIFISFLVLILELGFITYVSLNPKKVWNLVKKVDTYVINAGEMMTVYSNPNMQYLFGDKGSFEVTYYLPYLDAWSLYNTGYGLTESQQLIDTKSNVPELVDFECPQINGQNIRHWSILLADSFEYHGESHSILTGVIDKKGDVKRVVNGKYINNNAYRVVDHFMAPRVTFTEIEKGAKMQLKTTQNENYNGKFQKEFFDLIVKLALSVLMCFLSLLKLLTFLWQWYMLYVFFFKVILGKLAEKKGWPEILSTTFMPSVALFFMGLYNGTILQIGMGLSGFIGLIIIIAFFIITFKLIGWWYKLKGGAYFPLTLKPIYIITNKKAIEEIMKRRKIQENQDIDEEYGNMSLEEQYAYFYDKNGVEKATVKSTTYRDRVRRAMLMDRLNHEKENASKFRNEHDKTEEGKDMLNNVEKIMQRYKASGFEEDDINAWKKKKLKSGFKIDENDKKNSASTNSSESTESTESTTSTSTSNTSSTTNTGSTTTSS